MITVNGNLIDIVCDLCGKKDHQHTMEAAENDFKKQGWRPMLIEGVAMTYCPTCYEELLQISRV